MSTIACTLSPCLKTPSNIGPGTSPVSNAQSHHVVRNPRISLRFLASYKTMFYFILLYLLCKIFSLNSLTILAIFILVLFFSVLGHVCPKHHENDSLQKKLFWNTLPLSPLDIFITILHLFWCAQLPQAYWLVGLTSNASLAILKIQWNLQNVR